MTIAVFIRRNAVEATITSLGVSDYEVEQFDANRWSVPESWVDEYVMLRFADGKTLEIREENGADDSDFYATYRDDSGQFREICYGSTRSWTYPNYARVDADDTLQIEYLAWLRANERKRKAMALRSYRRERRGMLEKAGITFQHWLRLRDSLGQRDAAKLCLIMGKSLRSPFRRSCIEQVRGWLATATPKYDKPLSKRQLDRLLAYD